MNRYELEALTRRDGLVAVTLGAEGAMLLEDGEEVARAVAAARSTRSTARQRATRSPRASSSRCSRDASYDEALERACAAGALAASRHGAQPSLPTAAEIDAILRLSGVVSSATRRFGATIR